MRLPPELLTAVAWAHALGYLPAELGGKSLRGLMALEQPAAAEALDALVDKQDLGPLEVTLGCKDEPRKRFRVYRRFDHYDEVAFLVADETTEDLESR